LSVNIICMISWINEYIKGLSSAEYHLQVSLLFIFLIILIVKIYKTYHRYRYINDTATSKIASAAQGYVELKGMGEFIPGLEITSPFSNRRCLWYQCIVEKKNRSGKYNSWSEQTNDVSDQLFYLEDNTAECVVMPEGALVVPSEELIWYGSSYQAKSRGKLKSWWFSRYIGFGLYRFTEKIISVAEPLYVSGLFKSIQKKSDINSTEKQVEELIKNWKKEPQKKLQRFDLDNNGKIQKQEWKLVRKKAIEEVREKQQQNFVHIVKKTIEKNQPFIISALSEEALKRKKLRILSIYLVLFFFLLITLIAAVKF